MKIKTILASVTINIAYGQYTGAVVTTEGAKFATSVFNTMMICNDWIQRSLVCDNQSKKINKYKYRTDRVLKERILNV